MQNLLNFTYEELENFIISIGEAKFRAKQIFAPMHKGISPAELTNLSAKTKEKILENIIYFGVRQMKDRAQLRNREGTGNVLVNIMLYLRVYRVIM